MPAPKHFSLAANKPDNAEKGSETKAKEIPSLSGFSSSTPHGSNNTPLFGQPTKSTRLPGFSPVKPMEEPVEASEEEHGDEEDEEDQGGSASNGDSGGDSEQADENYDPDSEPQDEEEDEGEEEENEDDGDDESEDDDIQTAMVKANSKSKSLFDRIEPNPNRKSDGTRKMDSQEGEKKSNGFTSNPFGTNATSNSSPFLQPAANNSFKPFSPNSAIGTPKAPAMSPFTPVNGTDAVAKDSPVSSLFSSTSKPVGKESPSSFKVNGETFSFASKPSAPTSNLAQSVLFGASMSLASGAIPGEGLFGSRPSTPSNAETSGGSVFGNLGKAPNFSGSQSDNTWKAGAQIKFGTPDKDAPTFSVTAATPPAKDDSAALKPFANLFGGIGASSSKTGSSNTPSVGFGFGGPSAIASPRLTPSLLGSAVSSRATSPGATDTESVNTDTAEDHSNDPQASLMSSRPGEEDEEVLYEARAKALKMLSAEALKGTQLDPGYNTQGVGQLRVLKHTYTGKTRLLLRAEPGSNIIINTALVASMSYTSQSAKGSGAVKFGIPTKDGVEHWVVKVKTAAMAEELAAALEANKGART